MDCGIIDKCSSILASKSVIFTQNYLGDKKSSCEKKDFLGNYRRE